VSIYVVVDLNRPLHLDFCSPHSSGVFNVVPGFGATAGKALSEHPGLGKLDLTGGTETGRIAAAAAGKNLVQIHPRHQHSVFMLNDDFMLPLYISIIVGRHLLSWNLAVKRLF
jgi:hypothetical protein